MSLFVSLILIAICTSTANAQFPTITSYTHDGQPVISVIGTNFANISTTLVLGSLSISAPPPVSSTLIVVPLPLSARNGPMYLQTNDVNSNVFQVKLTPYISNASPVLSTKGGNFTITGRYLNSLRSNGDNTSITVSTSCYYYDFDHRPYFQYTTRTFQFTPVRDFSTNEQMVINYPVGAGQLTGSFSIDGVSTAGSFTPNYGNPTVISYRQDASMLNMILTVDYFGPSYCWYRFSRDGTNYILSPSWINSTSFSISLEYSQGMLVQTPRDTTLYSANNQLDISFNLISSFQVSGAVPTGGGYLPVKNKICFLNLKSCTLGNQTINGQFPCDQIPIPAGTGLNNVLNCTDTNGFPISSSVTFDYGPSVGLYSFDIDTLVLNGYDFTPSTTVKFADGSQYKVSDNSTPTKAFVTMNPNTPPTGSFTVTVGGVSAGPFIYKTKPILLKATIADQLDPSGKIIPGQVKTSAPYSVFFPLPAPSITSIQPIYTISTISVQVTGNLVNATILNGTNAVFCQYINATVVNCPLFYGNLTAYFLGVYSALMPFNYQPRVSNEYFINNGSRLTITGSNFSPYAYLLGLRGGATYPMTSSPSSMVFNLDSNQLSTNNIQLVSSSQILYFNLYIQPEMTTTTSPTPSTGIRIPPTLTLPLILFAILMSISL
ncbi:hypothetical protein SAMD00019534_004270 [Acytostelium subglobosum LB1]|uniref:hypothetical protein n=1 Tax=Acytostelium subglobosum LB1 TaxID=1410327 RepID=UPI000644BF27|nr:hypothetical protein SAMD00019534_004270 [Acytostelium subglobosum LB1]GAM17252.1 hypothetical protein SAMD00019534_004270 [Acytostelium subglobosum LB1]|eukprot:XP_012759314.1 hypothetical protein SAMD00019534_004270 [Acytostelium subglobosum LB1]